MFRNSAAQRRLALAALGALALLSVASRAQAERFAIDWQAPEACGTRDELEAGVARIAGKPFDELGSAWVSADVQIVAASDAFRLRVRVVSTRGAQRERDVVTASCREALEAAELIVATSLSGNEAEAARTTAPPVAPPREAPAKRAEPAAPPAHRQALPVTASLAARVGLEPLLLPSPVPIGWLLLGLETKRLKLELALGGTLHESAAVDGGGSAVASLLTAGLAACYGAPAGAFELWGCAGGEAGRFRVEGQAGSALLDPRASNRFWSAGLLQGELSRQVTRGLALVLGAQGVVAGRSVRVLQSGSGGNSAQPLYKTSRVDVRPWLSAEVRF
ncbi:MAG TPA: hypothetical protein VHW01_29370 [Polyangiaceae bacterium]|jgi:hypothetical protein|nr:hypothetical protein [Polyangiaceae bacterium]